MCSLFSNADTPSIVVERMAGDICAVAAPSTSLSPEQDESTDNLAPVDESAFF